MIVGLDFGTHQTKICIADYSDPQRPIHRFWKFHTPNGDSFMLPSVIQINTDDTLTYGYVDENNAKCMPLLNRPKPLMPNIEKPIWEFKEKEPKLVLPEKPNPKKIDWKEQLKAITTGTCDILSKWKEDCEEAKLDYDQDYRLWKIGYEKAKKAFDEKMSEYEKVMSRYEDDIREWESVPNEPSPAIFRYFKIASFSNAKWEYIIDKDILCIWYIAYILFDLEKELGQTFSIQIGYPTDAKRLRTRKSHAIRLILSAYHLVEDVFHGEKDEFLRTPYTDLLSITKVIIPSFEKKEEYGILALPEAYANLVTATNQHKISQGISFIVDIGGGTTDVSLFEIGKNGEPHIYGYSSMDVGINYLIENVAGQKSMIKQNSLNELSPNCRIKAAQLFSDELNKEVKKIVTEIFEAFKDINLPTSALIKALQNRVVVFSGGGSTYPDLCFPIGTFTDLKKMDATIWNGFVFENDSQVKSLASILSTALGLSIPRDHDDIKVSETEEIFAHLPKNNKTEHEELIWGRRPEEMYGMMDD